MYVFIVRQKKNLRKSEQKELSHGMTPLILYQKCSLNIFEISNQFTKNRRFFSNLRNQFLFV